MSRSMLSILVSVSISRSRSSTSSSEEGGEGDSRAVLTDSVSELTVSADRNLAMAAVRSRSLLVREFYCKGNSGGVRVNLVERADAGGGDPKRCIHLYNICTTHLVEGILREFSEEPPSGGVCYIPSTTLNTRSRCGTTTRVGLAKVP